MPKGIKGSYRVYNCLHCSKENKYGANKTNKFCNNTCQQLHIWETITKPAVERGECTSASRAPKRYIIEVCGEICAECQTGPEWNGKPLTLELDHIDGNSDNNLPSNLRLLCPNCHSQTDTHGSKGQGKRYKKVTKRNLYLQEYKAKDNARLAQR